MKRYSPENLTTNEALAVLTSYHLSDADLRNLMFRGPVKLVQESPKFDTAELGQVMRDAAHLKASILPVTHPIRSRAAALWKIGSIEHNRRVSFVSSTEARPECLDIAADLARSCALLGIDVIADLVTDEDDMIHQAVAKAHAHPIAVLSYNIGDIPFERQAAARRVVSAQGALLSAYAPRLRAESDFAVERAQTSASLSQLVVITSAATLISGPGAAARRARALRVPVAAVPGSPGCDTLIANKDAYPIEHRDDLLVLLKKLYDR